MFNENNKRLNKNKNLTVQTATYQSLIIKKITQKATKWGKSQLSEGSRKEEIKNCPAALDINILNTLKMEKPNKICLI
ncbi:hypothetical protein [Flavobacterium ginsenosidimutans]|uniref:Uncharacterized protein n=1 Tax=Flavobacterium ginsenosidimutans TaxID=687844 RepID=A0ABZ2Q7W3_9FLAO